MYVHISYLISTFWWNTVLSVWNTVLSSVRSTWSSVLPGVKKIYYHYYYTLWYEKPFIMYVNMYPSKLPNAAGCLQWISATYNVSQCTYLLDCRGIQCYSVRTIQSATISIAEPCSEVISVQLLLEDFSRNTLLQDSFSNSGVTPFTVQDYNGYIIMSRNDTTLNVSVRLYRMKWRCNFVWLHSLSSSIITVYFHLWTTDKIS